jgi:hypothetical protein
MLDDISGVLTRCDRTHFGLPTPLWSVPVSSLDGFTCGMHTTVLGVSSAVVFIL